MGCPPPPALCAEVVSAFAAELDHSLRWRAKAALGLSSVADAHTGAVVAVQRTDSALRLNMHFHVLALDGVYVRDAAHDALVFHPLSTPTHAEVADVARRTAERIERILHAHGRSLDPEMQDDEPPELCSDEPGLAACYSAAARSIAVCGEHRASTWCGTSASFRATRSSAGKSCHPGDDLQTALCP